MHGHGLEVLPHDDPSVLGFDARGLDRIVSTLWAWHLAGDAGMQLAVYRSGTLVLAVACGRDPFTDRPIRHDTRFCLLSTTKALAALAMLHLRSNGCFDWEDQIIDYWPAFGQGDKQAATIEHLMCHRIRIPRVTAPWQRWIDRSHMARLIETSHVEWDPGTRYGYHGGSFGFIVDELCRRLAGRTAGQILHEIAVKVGHPDCYIGLPQPYMKRVAKLQFLEPDQRPTAAAGEGNPGDAVGTGRDLVSVRGGGGSLQGTSGICRGPLRGPLPSTCAARPRAPAEARASLGRGCVGSVLDPPCGVDVVQSAARADVRLGLGVPQARPRGLHAEPRGPACHRRVGPTAANRPRLGMAGPNQRR